MTFGCVGSNPTERTMESEPAGAPGLAANESALHGVGFDCSALRPWMMNRTGAPAPAGNGMGGRPLVIVSSVIRAWKLNRAGEPAPPRKRLGAQALGFEFSGFRHGR